MKRKMAAHMSNVKERCLVCKMYTVQAYTEYLQKVYAVNASENNPDQSINIIAE